MLLLLGAVGQDVRCHDVGVQAEADPARASARDFLDQHGTVQARAATAAVLLGYGGAQQARRAGLAPDGARHDAIGFPACVMGDDLFFQKAAGLVPEEFVFFTEEGAVEHGSVLEIRLTLAWPTVTKSCSSTREGAGSAQRAMQKAINQTLVR